MADHAVPPTPRRQSNGTTIYETGPPRSTGHYLLALGVVAGFISLFAAPVGWWLAGWMGALAGVALSIVIFAAADGMTVREIRTFADGRVEFVSSWRRIRVASSEIVEIVGYFDQDEGDRSYNFSIARRWRPVGVDDFPELPAFISEVRTRNPALRLRGEWPSDGPQLRQ